MAGLLDYLSRGTDALAGTTGSYGGLLGKEEQDLANKQARMMLAASLLEAGGPSAERKSLGQALSRGMMAAQQGRQGSVDQSLQAALLRKQLQSAEQQSNPYGAISPDKFTPESLREFAKTKDYGVLVPRESPQSSASIAEFEFFQRLTPEQQKQFMALQRSPVLPQLAMVNGVQTLVDRTAKDPQSALMPLTSLDSEVGAISTKAKAEAEAKGIGSALGEAKGGIEKKAIGALNVLDTLDLAEPLVDVATGSATGAARDKVASFFGKSMEGDQAIAQLKILQANLMTNMPRMEGPQSDRDVQLYRDAAGELGDPTVPNGRKKAAINMIRSLQQKYVEAGSGPKAQQQKRTPEEIKKQYGL